MPRVQANNYETKRLAVMDAAAKLFSENGYSITKLDDVAKACNASKSMIYHYFSTKEDILFQLLKDHLEFLIESMKQTPIDTDEPQRSFTRFVSSYIKESAKTRTRHVVAMNEKKFLSADKHAVIVALEKQSLKIHQQFLKSINPTLSDPAIKAYALMLVGMLNWTDLWYKPSGKIKPDELTSRVSELFLHGFLTAK